MHSRLSDVECHTHTYKTLRTSSSSQNVSLDCSTRINKGSKFEDHGKKTYLLTFFKIFERKLVDTSFIDIITDS